MQDGALAADEYIKIISGETGKDADHRSSGGGYKRGWLSQTTQGAFPVLWDLNVGILPKESWVVSEEENYNNKTMSEGEEGGDEGIWMDGEEEQPDDLR